MKLILTTQSNVSRALIRIYYDIRRSEVAYDNRNLLIAEISLSDLLGRFPTDKIVFSTHRRLFSTDYTEVSKQAAILLGAPVNRVEDYVRVQRSLKARFSAPTVKSDAAYPGDLIVVLPELANSNGNAIKAWLSAQKVTIAFVGEHLPERLASLNVTWKRVEIPQSSGEAVVKALFAVNLEQ